MKTISPPIRITVTSSGGGTSLAALVASMSAGTWAQLTTATNQNAVLGVGPTDGDMLPYCHKCAWNPVSRRIEVIGADHNYVNSGMGTGFRWAQYDEATNNWIFQGDQPTMPLPAHGYDHLEVNPANGDLYFKTYGTATVSPLGASRRRVSVGAWESINGPSTLETASFGTCWWTGALAGFGAQGGFLVFNAGNAAGGAATDGVIMGYDPLAVAWVMNQDSMAPFYDHGIDGVGTYHTCMAYSAVKNCAVYGGGNGQPNKLWRLNSDKTFTVMPDVPAGKAAGVQRGLVLSDPVTGNFLLLSAGELWELNPSSSGTWTQQTGTRTPPAGVGILGPATVATNDMIGVSLPDHGVVAYIKQQGPTNSSFWIYKHA